MLFLGLLCNILSLATIVSMKKKSLFHKLLITLAAYDLLFIANGGLFMTQRAFSYNSRAFTLVFPKVIYPLAGIGMTGMFNAICFSSPMGVSHLRFDTLKNSVRTVSGLHHCVFKQNYPTESRQLIANAQHMNIMLRV